MSGHDRAGAPVELGGRYVVGADGLRSRVAGLVDATINEAGRAGGAVQYTYYTGIPWSGIEFFVAERSFAGVFPTHDGQACIWVCTPSHDAKAVRRRTGSRVEAFSQLLERGAPELAERLRQARRTSPVQGMLRQPNQLRQAFGPGWALVGDADHPAVLVGQDQGPTPVEFILHALAACLTAGLANIAAARKVKLTEVRSTVTGDIDLNGILGLNPEVRNGYQQITVRFTIKGDAPAETLRELLEQSRARSAVYDVITNGVPVTIDADTP